MSNSPRIWYKDRNFPEIKAPSREPNKPNEIVAVLTFTDACDRLIKEHNDAIEYYENKLKELKESFHSDFDSIEKG